MMQLAQVAQAVSGQMIGPDVMLNGVATDTRGDCGGRLFVALQGDNFDAHDYVSLAFENGAAAAMVEQPIDQLNMPCVLVSSTHQALKDLSAWWRAQFAIPLIAITGSVGKTSVKEMVGSIFTQISQGVVTHGNLNNEIGVPLTLMRLSNDDRFAVVEMGMNRAGEISRLTSIAQPTIALVNNAAAAHLEGLGSIEAVAHAKGEIFEGLSADGIAVINLDDKFSSLWLSQVESHKTISYGLIEGADVTAEFELNDSSISMNIHCPEQSFAVEMAVIGEHNVLNALAAVAVSIAANMPVDAIIAGLEAYRPIGGRLNIKPCGALTILDDSYNANPASMRAAIDALKPFSQSTLIVGDMAELGAATEQAHVEIGEYAAQQNIGSVYACGHHAELVAQGYGNHARVFADQPALLDYLKTTVFLQGAVLVKGSRSAQMENVVTFLENHYAVQSGGQH